MRIRPNKNVLQEGVLPDPNSFGMLEYTATLARYGDYIKYSDEALEYPIDDLHASIVTEMGYSFKDFLEEIRSELYYTSKNVWYANGATNDSTITVKGISLHDLPKLAAFFKRNNVTPAMGNDYVLIVPPEALVPLESVAKKSDEFTYVELAKDTSAEVLFKGAEGKIFRFLLVVSNSIKIDESGYAKCIALGKVKGKWGTDEISLEGENLPELINKGIDTGGADNALNQVGSIGWKIHGWGGVVANEEAVAIYHIKLDDSYEEWADDNRNGVKSKVVFTNGTGTETTTPAGNTPVVNGK